MAEARGCRSSLRYRRRSPANRVVPSRSSQPLLRWCREGTIVAPARTGRNPRLQPTPAAGMMRPMTNHQAWFTAYPPDVPHSLAPYPKESVFALLRNAAAGFPDRPALAFFGAHMTYSKLLSEVERFSAALAGLGVRRGDRVGMILPNCPE